MSKKNRSRKLAKAINGLPKRLAKISGDRSQRQFAHDLGVFQQNVNRYENGTLPHSDFLGHLALTEGVSIDWLLTGHGEPYRKSA